MTSVVCLQFIPFNFQRYLCVAVAIPGGSEIKTVEIRGKFNETYYFKVKHSNFKKPNLSDFEGSNFPTIN